MIRLSKSGVKTYEICPRKYRFIYVEKMSLDEGAEARRGKELHKKFEEFYNEIKKPEDIKDKKWEELRGDPDTNNFLNFVDYLYETLGNKEEVIPLAKEIKYYDPQLDVVGVIDVVYKAGDKYILLDYKTGKFDERYMSDYRFELAIYAYLWNKNNMEKITHWGVLFTKCGKLWVEEIKSASTTFALKKIEKVKQLIKQERFEPTFSVLCSYCPYIGLCVEESEKIGETNCAFLFKKTNGENYATTL